MKLKGIVLTLSGIVLVALILFMTKLAIDSNNHYLKQYSQAVLEMKRIKWRKNQYIWKADIIIYVCSEISEECHSCLRRNTTVA